MSTSLNIALLGKDFGWSGGVELLRNLANALLSLSDERQLKLHLLLPVRNRIDNLADLRFVVGTTAERLLKQGKFSLPRQEPVFEASVPDYFKNVDGAVEIVEYNLATGLIPVLKRIEADVVIPAAAPLGRNFPIPWVGYVYDFQHKYYPDYFNAGDGLGRDIHFASMLREAKAVLVNAKSVKNDIDKFFPYHECEVFALPFSAAPVANWLEDGNPERLKSYNLPQRYFLISNQFWIHKSHITAFRALALLAKEQQFADLHIVCTGKMEDYRFPDHIRDLEREISELNIADRVHFLGHIPKADQIAIMKGSLAVLQPTFFEGGPGGGSVYDAVSLGVPALLSDIPVNREIEKERNIFYFETGSATDLAEKIGKFLKIKINRPSKGELIEQGMKRKKLLGECLLRAANYVMTKTP